MSCLVLWLGSSPPGSAPDRMRSNHSPYPLGSVLAYSLIANVANSSPPDRAQPATQRVAPLLLVRCHLGRDTLRKQVLLYARGGVAVQDQNDVTAGDGVGHGGRW